MEIKLLKTEDQATEEIRDFIILITDITPDEIETDTTFRAWLGKDGLAHKAIGIEIDRLKYPDGYRYKAYLALLHNITIMMADYSSFLIWIDDINPDKL